MVFLDGRSLTVHLGSCSPQRLRLRVSRKVSGDHILSSPNPSAERCSATEKAENCLAQVPAFVHRVEQIRKDLLAEHKDVSHVVVTSDERNATFWSQLRDLGWKYIDHDQERTVDVYNKWYMSLARMQWSNLTDSLVVTGIRPLSTRSSSHKAPDLWGQTIPPCRWFLNDALRIGITVRLEE